MIFGNAITGAIQRFFSPNDVIAIYDMNGRQVFSAARPMKINPKPNAKLMENPAETGILVTDHRILNSIEIEISLILPGPDYSDVFQQIKEAYVAGTLLKVQTREDVYENQMIQDMSYEQSPDLIDALVMGIRRYSTEKSDAATDYRARSATTKTSRRKKTKCRV